MGVACREESSSRLLQMFKCATCQNPTGSCSGAPVRTAYNGPGHLGEWNTSGREALGLAQAMAITQAQGS